MTERAQIGWRERASLPDWGIEGVIAKIDTGAKTSALHVEEIEEMEDQRIRFLVALGRRGKLRHVPIEADWVRRAQVRSSSGKVQSRYVVRTTLQIGLQRHDAEFTLVSRKDMLCRMLIGRAALGCHYIILPDEKFLQGGKK